jgi:Domain of unknown function (DUF3471)
MPQMRSQTPGAWFRGARFVHVGQGYEPAGGRAGTAKGARVTGTVHSLTLGKYARTYHRDGHGQVTVREEGGNLILHDGPAFIGALEQWHYDSFEVTWRDRLQGRALAMFTSAGQRK